MKIKENWPFNASKVTLHNKLAYAKSADFLFLRPRKSVLDRGLPSLVTT